MGNESVSAILLLSDGTLFEGVGVGGNETGYSVGELVFNTGMTGYQEVITDPSYSGQIVTFTYPHIGNYGVNELDLESATPHVSGVVVREMTKCPSNQRATSSLPDWLKKHQILGIENVDTRALAKHLREHGVMLGVIAHHATRQDAAKWLDLLQNAQDYGSIDFVAQRAIKEPMRVDFKNRNDIDPAHFGPLALKFSPLDTDLPTLDDDSLHVVVLDYGTKWSIYRSLLERHVKVTAVPYTTTREQIDALNPDGLLISNGPGDPAQLVAESRYMKELALAYPTFGICLGHQLLAQGFGAKTFKLRYGHRGPNQPCLNADDDSVVITSQNHGYAVDRQTLPPELLEISKNLNDDTLSGLRHRDLPVFSVQYHPEAGPGPNDAKCEFDQFIEMIRAAKLKKKGSG